MTGPGLPANGDVDLQIALNYGRNEFRPTLPVSHHRRCYVTHSGIGVKRLLPIRDTLFEHLSRRTSRHLHLYAWYKYLREKRISDAPSNLLLLHNHWSGGYYHWMNEVLVKLQFVDLDSHTVIIPEDYPRFAHESLELMGVKNVLRLPPDRASTPNI